MLKTCGAISEAENDPEASGAGCLLTWTGSKLHVQFRFLSATSITDEVLHAHQRSTLDAGAILIVSDEVLATVLDLRSAASFKHTAHVE